MGQREGQSGTKGRREGQREEQSGTKGRTEWDKGKNRVGQREEQSGTKGRTEWDKWKERVGKRKGQKRTCDDSIEVVDDLPARVQVSSHLHHTHLIEPSFLAACNMNEVEVGMDGK